MDDLKEVGSSCGKELRRMVDCEAPKRVRSVPDAFGSEERKERDSNLERQNISSSFSQVLFDSTFSEGRPQLASGRPLRRYRWWFSLPWTLWW